MQYTVLGGAGIEGSGIVRDLVKSAVEEVVIADRDIDSARSLAAKLTSARTRVSAFFVDADDSRRLAKALKKAGVVVSALGRFYRYGAQMLANGEIHPTGVLCPEQCIPPERLFSGLSKRGIRVQETVRTEHLI